MIKTPIQLLHDYSDASAGLFPILYKHSRQVADKALDMADRHPEWNMDRNFIEEAALLHDIGVSQTKAPTICCYGTYPYICHGYLGADILRAEGLKRHALVCERHTGTGLSIEEIEKQQLPLPHRDMRPQTLEEQLICFADKFFSKTSLEKERTVEEARQKLVRFGEEQMARFDKWCRMFL